MTAALGNYGQILRARWRWIMWAVLLTLAVTTASMLIWPPLYRSQATVFVRTPGDVSQVQDGGDSYAQGRAQTYAALANSTSVSARVIADLGLNLSEQTLSDRIRATHPGGTALIRISLSAPSEDEAQRALGVLLSEYSATVRGLESVPGALVPRAELVIVDPPEAAARLVAGVVPIPLLFLGMILFGLTIGAFGAVLTSIVKPAVRKEDRGAAGTDDDVAPSQPQRANRGTEWT